ncbi:hypothetical protein EJ06DRAFT_360121 [Trichodelitschia bisporula]|uniref:Uncharacterized protein n=1 Tax=Trichodelitschia bisporula TaxID=703511 RepID=A0A6G1I127_9PEZI|nr:hypothetical protein EJ06DRAFT_360121 [Trichodelitschia bisporula]
MFDPEFLFDHTRKLRIDDKLSSIDAKKLLKWLLARWTSVEIPDVALKQLEQDEVEDSSFERDVNDFKKDEEDETNRFRSRRVVIERNRSLSPERRANDLLPPICRGRRLGRFPPSQGVADHWKPFHFRPDNLLQSLSQHGWKPVYMRGNASGQTWFCGALPVHVRRFKEDYTPQDTAWDPKKNPGEQAYLIVGPEWVEEAELQRLGFSYKALPSGHFSLDPRLASHDVLCLVDATAVMREERLYRKYRTLPGGDLFEPSSISVPDVDFLHGGLGLGSGSASHMHEGSGLHNAGKFVPSEEKVRHRFEDMSMMGARISELGGDMSAPEMAPETTPSEQTYMSEPFVEVSK